ncbi:hypothetical protein [Clostridium nigeriense]|uniref:hypothetical protein n=1 Tax=Clostridium nigeriense TaxID=1805470 RepID=UPI000829E587|nr:hypothetical protein [Clostridium nigeriense]
MNRKKAFALLETLVVLMLIVLLVSISINLISYNYLKSQTFNSFSDKKTLNIEEEIILKNINKEKNYTYEDSKFKLIKKSDGYYLVRKEYNSNIYLRLDIKSRNGENILVPTYYKTKNIMGDINYD